MNYVAMKRKTFETQETMSTLHAKERLSGDTKS